MPRVSRPLIRRRMIVIPFHLRSLAETPPRWLAGPGIGGRLNPIKCRFRRRGAMRSWLPILFHLSPALTYSSCRSSLKYMVPLTRHGWREMLIGSLVLAITFAGLGHFFWPLALIVIPVFIWLFAFFRDPNRTVPVEQHAMVSPADGKVSDITEIEHDEKIGGPAVRVGIFLSVFNVHINRSPCDSRVLEVEYKRGKIINAMKHNDASSQNESSYLLCWRNPNGTEPIMRW